LFFGVLGLYSVSLFLLVLLGFVLILLFFALFAAMASARVSSAFPPVTFLRTFYPGDFFQSAYCLENGAYANWYDNSYQERGQLFQSCGAGQITLSATNNLILGNMGQVAAASTKLGTELALRARYGIANTVSAGSVYGSITWNGTDLMIIQSFNAQTWVPLLATDIAPLMTTQMSNSLPLSPQQDVGNIFIARITEMPVTPAKKMTDSTVLLIKGYMVSSDGKNTLLRWEVLGYDKKGGFSLGVSDPGSHLKPSHQKATLAVGVTAIVLGAIGVTLAIFALVLARKRQHYTQIQ